MLNYNPMDVCLMGLTPSYVCIAGVDNYVLVDCLVCR